MVLEYVYKYAKVDFLVIKRLEVPEYVYQHVLMDIMHKMIA
jgi:hypothetical protein